LGRTALFGSLASSTAAELRLLHRTVTYARTRSPPPSTLWLSLSPARQQRLLQALVRLLERQMQSTVPNKTQEPHDRVH